MVFPNFNSPGINLHPQVDITMLCLTRYHYGFINPQELRDIVLLSTNMVLFETGVRSENLNMEPIGQECRPQKKNKIHVRWLEGVACCPGKSARRQSSARKPKRNCAVHRISETGYETWVSKSQSHLRCFLFILFYPFLVSHWIVVPWDIIESNRLSSAWSPSDREWTWFHPSTSSNICQLYISLYIIYIYIFIHVCIYLYVYIYYNI